MNEEVVFSESTATREPVFSSGPPPRGRHRRQPRFRQACIHFAILRCAQPGHGGYHGNDPLELLLRVLGGT